MARRAPSAVGPALLAAAALLTLAQVVLSSSGTGPPWCTEALHHLALLGCLVALADAARRRGWSGAGRAVTLVGASSACLLVAGLLRSWSATGAGDVPPWVAEAPRLLSHVVACAAVVAVVRPRTPRPGAWHLLDGVLAATSALALGLVLVVAPGLPATAGAPARALAAALPLSGVVVLAVVVGGLSVLGWRCQPSAWLVLAGLALTVLPDVTAGPLATGPGALRGHGGPADLLAAVGGVAAAAAAVRGGPLRVATARCGLPVLVAPAVCALVGCAVLLAAAGRPDVAPEAAPLAAATLVGCFVRAGGLLRDVQHLPETQRQALTDELTGLANRRALQRALDERLRPDPSGLLPRTVLLVVDLDGFKQVNDTLGHQQGDELLAVLGSRLRRLAGDGELVARLGGDEFALVLHGRSATQVAATAEDLVAAVGLPVAVDGIGVSVGCSVGVAVAPQHARSRGELLRCADAAMYSAKRQGGGISVFRPESARPARGDLALLTQLRSGIAAGELVLHHQPVVDVATRRQVGTEALVRWQHPVLGLLPPDRFVPVAEAHGLARPLTDVVLDLALEQLAQQLTRGVRTRVAVNVPAPLLHDGGLPERVAALLRRHGVPPSCLTVEITETGLLPDGDGPLSATSALRALGVDVSVDDYGTGYTSVASLRRLDVSEMKLDASLLVNAVRDVEGARAILQSTVELAHALGLRVVGEGVETEEHLALLAALGVQRAQGYLLGRPAPLVAPTTQGPAPAQVTPTQVTPTQVTPTQRPAEVPAPRPSGRSAAAPEPARAQEDVRG